MVTRVNSSSESDESGGAADFSVTYYAAQGKANKIQLRASSSQEADQWMKVLQRATGRLTEESEEDSARSLLYQTLTSKLYVEECSTKSMMEAYEGIEKLFLAETHALEEAVNKTLGQSGEHL